LLPQGCCCRSDDNTNTNTNPKDDPEEGIRVETIGQAGTLLHDPTETHRHHDLTNPKTPDSRQATGEH